MKSEVEVQADEQQAQNGCSHGISASVSHVTKTNGQDIDQHGKLKLSNNAATTRMVLADRR